MRLRYCCQRRIGKLIISLWYDTPTNHNIWPKKFTTFKHTWSVQNHTEVLKRSCSLGHFKECLLSIPVKEFPTSTTFHWKFLFLIFLRLDCFCIWFKQTLKFVSFVIGLKLNSCKTFEFKLSPFHLRVIAFEWSFGCVKKKCGISTTVRHQTIAFGLFDQKITFRCSNPFTVFIAFRMTCFGNRIKGKHHKNEMTPNDLQQFIFSLISSKRLYIIHSGRE